MIFGKHINKYYLRYAWAYILGVLTLGVVDWFQLYIPEIYSQVIEGLSADTQMPLTTELLLQLCIKGILVVAVLIVGRCLWRQFFFGTCKHIGARVRADMFNHCKDLSQQYYQVNKVGDIMSLYTADLDTIEECTGDAAMMLFDVVILGGLSLFKMIRVNWLLTLLALIPMVCLGVMATIVGKRLEHKWDKRQQALASISDFTQENFSGIAVIKAFVKESIELLSFRRLNKANEDASVDFTKIATLFHVMVTFFVGSVTTIVIGFGGWLATTGRGLRVSDLHEFIGYFSALVWPVIAVSNLIEMSSRGKASLKRISDLLDAPIDVNDREGVEQIDKVDGKIEFRHLTFQHPGAENAALTDVTFTIDAGERVGLVGRTGSGKTTLVDLLLRTYNVPDGTLFIDDKDVNSVAIHSLRNFIAYVPQDNFLFSDTLSRNIAFYMGDAEVNQEEVERVARLADIHDNISEFKEGYDTMLGERGVTISGGQKQRTSIARALLKNASILIMDDSLSAVDTATESVILDNLNRERAGKTTILIAHRISSVQNMDKIILIDEGKVLDVGTHEELLSRSAEYQRMVALQELDAVGGEGGQHE